MFNMVQLLCFRFKAVHSSKECDVEHIKSKEAHGQIFKDTGQRFKINLQGHVSTILRSCFLEIFDNDAVPAPKPSTEQKKNGTPPSCICDLNSEGELTLRPLLLLEALSLIINSQLYTGTTTTYVKWYYSHSTSLKYFLIRIREHMLDVCCYMHALS